MMTTAHGANATVLGRKRDIIVYFSGLVVLPLLPVLGRYVAPLQSPAVHGMFWQSSSRGPQQGPVSGPGEGGHVAETDAGHDSAKGAVLAFPLAAPRPRIMFDRRELQVILRLYGVMVAAGEWRDYAIDMLSEQAVFSVFRRSSDMPLYRIAKTPRNARKQGIYSVMTADGRILKRGQDLTQVLRILSKKPKLVT